MSTQQVGQVNFTEANNDLGVDLGFYWSQVMSSYTQASCNAEKIYTNYQDLVLQMCIDTPTPLILDEVGNVTTTGIFKDPDNIHFTIVLDQTVNVPEGTYNYILSSTDSQLLKKVHFKGTIQFTQGAC